MGYEYFNVRAFGEEYISGFFGNSGGFERHGNQS